jgi:hypothetical protein
MGPIGCTETSAINCQTTLRNITEEQISHSHFDGKLNHFINEKAYNAKVPSAGPSGRAV